MKLSQTQARKPKTRYAEPLAIFEGRNEAENYRQKNKDWKVVDVKLTLPLTLE